AFITNIATLLSPRWLPNVGVDQPRRLHSTPRENRASATRGIMPISNLVYDSFICYRHGVTACFTVVPTFLPVRPVPLPTPLPKPPIPRPNSFPPFTGLPRDMFLPKRLPPRPELLPPSLYA